MIWVIVAVVAIFVIWLIAAFNGLVSDRRQTLNAWAQIDVQLKRRYDLIPNLVETVKGYMKHEQDTLEKVIQARNRAVAATGVKDKAQAETAVAAALTGFFALSEAYPELRSNENMAQLQEELRSTENKISFARQYYNDIVTSYNTKLESIPTSVIASMGGFTAKELFELEEPAAREPVKVSF